MQELLGPLLEFTQQVKLKDQKVSPAYKISQARVPKVHCGKKGSTYILQAPLSQ